MTDENSEDINKQVEADWIEHTNPFERVRSVVKQTYEPQSVCVIAERARTSENTARKYLRHLEKVGFVEETTLETGEVEYRRSPESLILEEADRLLSEMNNATLVSRISEMEEKVRNFQNEYGVEAPEDAMLSEVEIDHEILQAWQTTQRNLGFAKVALALSDAKQYLHSESIMADRLHEGRSNDT